MVIGNGMIATRFINYQNNNKKVVFASGVSNSKDTVAAHFEREIDLLKKTIQQNEEKQLVYFSTCSVEDEELINAPYVIHKKKAEQLIKDTASSYIIFRVSNLAGISNNPYTLLNYFIINILQGNPITIWENASRNIIGIDDMYAIADFVMQQKNISNTTINIANPKNYSVPKIVISIENHFNKKAIGNTIERGDNYNINISAIIPVIKQLNIQFNDEYLSTLLKKYYHSK